MTSEPLHTKYRPKRFSEVVGQDAVVNALSAVLEANTSHAFLFFGPSGCGKTTLARIAAKQLGCKTPQEVDSATYTSIDSIREITSSLSYRPLDGSPNRVIILNEVHALSKAAWQSLLMATEEPKPWVYWFLTTTEPMKVPETIKTRFTTFETKLVPVSILSELLYGIVEAEKLTIADGVVNVCAKQSRGSPRQAIVNLATCAAVKDRQEAYDLLRAAQEEGDAGTLVKALVRGTNWETVRPILTALADTNPETVRQTIRAYITKVVLNSNDERAVKQGVSILEAFKDPCNSFDGITPIVLSVSRLIL